MRRAFAITAVALLVLAGFVVYLDTIRPIPPASIPGPTPTNYTVVGYGSSADGFALSYAEWLPADYRADQTYRLVVYLHGQQDTSGRWFSGGLTNDLVQSLTNTSDVPDRTTAYALIDATRTDDAILIALNSRSGSGWYINSPCGGPQEQDVLDALAHEAGIRHIGSIYLMGESMGTEGTLFIAAQNPGRFAGVAVVAPVTDLFEDVAYRMSLSANPADPWAQVSINAKAHLFCGVLPGPTNSTALSVARMFENMSPLRFGPAAFSWVPIYLTAGGLDNRAPNNLAYWGPWMNANNTFVNATCNAVPVLGEPVPPDCAVQTMDYLHRQAPSSYSFRYVFEPLSGHAVSQLDPADMLGFWFGTEPGGYYLGAASSGTITANPSLNY